MKTKYKAKRLESGAWEYRGYRINKMTDRRHAIAPWKIFMLRGMSFQTLSEAKKWIDQRIALRPLAHAAIAGTTLNPMLLSTGPEVNEVQE